MVVKKVPFLFNLWTFFVLYLRLIKYIYVFHLEDAFKRKYVS